MTMSMPGQVRPHQVLPAASRRLGLLRMVIGSGHMITLRPKDGPPRTQQVIVRDRRLYPKAKGLFVCLSSACRGRQWETEAAMVSDHPDAHTMERQGEIHVYGLWSEELLVKGDPASGVLGLMSTESAVDQ